MWWWILKGYLWLLSVNPLVFLVAAAAAGWFSGWKWAVAIIIFAIAVFGPIVFLPTLLPLLLQGIGWGISKLDSLRAPEVAA
jgi:hypothetical protein